MLSNDVFLIPKRGETELPDGGASVEEDRGTAADGNGTSGSGRSAAEPLLTVAAVLRLL